jgi:Flp pilus assembly pilin Flp
MQAVVQMSTVFRLSGVVRRSLRRFARCQQGAEQMEYVLIFAAVVVPLVYAVRLMWAVLLYYFTCESLVIDLPFF